MLRFVSALLCIMPLVAACDQLPLPHAEGSKIPDASASIERGYQLLDANQPEQALAIFDQAVRADSRQLRAHQGRGIALAQQGKHTDAQGAYEAALKLDGKSVSVRNNMAMNAMLQGDYGKAAATLVPLAQEAPNHQMVQHNLALLRCLQGNLGEARAIYSRTLKPAEVEDNLRFCRRFEQLRAHGASPSTTASPPPAR